MSKLIAVIDDEKDIVDLISLNLKKNNYKVAEYYNSNSFLESLKETLPDLVILDLMLPDIDGIETCKILRSQDKYKKIPVIMLTAKREELDKVLGLEIGADDYMTKPFSLRELIARVKAILRRTNIEEEIPQNKIINIDDKIFINLDAYEVFDANNNKIELTSTEFNILLILYKKRGWVFSRDKLLDLLWGHDKYVIERTIDVHIRNLREKLGDNGNLITNVRRVGYKLESKK